MKRITCILMVLITFLLLSACGKDTVDHTDPQPPIPNSPTPAPVSDPIQEQIKGMTLDEKIGQMVISGVDGYTVGPNTLKMIHDYHVSGFIILGENVKSTSQLLNLVNSLKTTNKDNKIPLFLSVDEEGGRISRMPSELKRIPTNKAIGEVNNATFSNKIGRLISEELNAFGFNVNFAPVLDINSNPNNPVIGDRSFGANPEIVTKLGIQTMKGIESGNIISVVKHFPGHGDTSVDSHVGLPSVNHDMERLKSFELIPFTDAIHNQVDGIMVAHILLPKIDPKYPASMSKTIITNTLRNDLKFDGVVFTDDMTMGAITKNYKIGDAAVTSINAGSDVILVCHLFDNEVAVIKGIKNAVQNGVLSEDRINQSVYRILKLKDKYKIDNTIKDTVDIKSLNNKISDTLTSNP